MYLIDSSVLIDDLRAGRDPVAEHQVHFDEGLLCTCGIVVCEVLRGVAKRRVFDRMETFFGLMESVPLDEPLVRDAYLLAWKLDRDGVVLPLPDLLIAAAALRRGATVVTSDPHFASVPGLATRSRLG